MKSSFPDVTIVIPVYNRSRSLVRAIRSCFVQDCAVEIVVVDDGSTENIRATLEEHFLGQLFADGAPRIRLIRQSNQGACVARNAGLAAATGAFVKFLDSDDELQPGALPQEIQGAQRAGCEALLTGWEERTFREDGTEDPTRRLKRPAPDLRNGIDDMLAGNAPCASSALYRTNFVQPLRWDPAWTKAQDWGWALTVCLAGAQFHSLDLVSCIYNHHPGERITRHGDVVLRSTRARQQMLRMIEAALRRQAALNPARRRKLAQYYYRDCQVLARNDPSEWRRVWTHCRELCPDFRPAEPRRIVRWFSRCLGIYSGVRLYVLLKPLGRAFGAKRHPGR